MCATSTGSPASRSPRKLTPFTTRPALTSRHGMILFASMETDSLAETLAPLKRERPPRGIAPRPVIVYFGAKLFSAEIYGTIFTVFMARAGWIRGRRLRHADRRGR